VLSYSFEKRGIVLQKKVLKKRGNVRRCPPPYLNVLCIPRCHMLAVVGEESKVEVVWSQLNAEA
jgi:hypothetical protein